MESNKAAASPASAPMSSSAAAAAAASSGCMSIYSPELLWQGGADNGKPEPVFSLDMHPSNVLATAGNDENIPPKGSVRLWRIDVDKDGQEFIIEFSDHQSVVNTVRFSPCGRMIASASDKQIVVYKVANRGDWLTLTDMRSVERVWLRPSLDEIFDLKWSPDSAFLLAGALDNKAEILRVSTRDSMLLPGHTNYVQGVAWDPLNALVVTQSADRTCRAHLLNKPKAGAMLKLAPRGHVTARMHLGCDKGPEGREGDAPLTAADFGVVDEASAGGAAAAAAATAAKSRHLFADHTVQSYFRRPDFSPDGSLLIAPTGIHRPSPAKTGDREEGHVPSSFCTHVFDRHHLASPILSLAGLEDPSVSVRCCPRLFKLVRRAGEGAPECMVTGAYRVVFAVTTLTAVYVYDTQHPFPLVRVGGLHFACINDATWSADGRMLTVCSSDGYLTFIKFAEGALGELLEAEAVPESVRQAFPCVYGIEREVVVAVVKEKKEKEGAAAAAAAAAGAGPGAGEAGAEAMAVEAAPSDAACLVSPPRAPTAPSAAGPPSASSETKKRRIAPTVIGLPGAAEGYGNVNTLASSSAAAPPDPAAVLGMVQAHVAGALPQVAALAAAAAATQDKKKRRITPTLVTHSLPVDIAAPSAEAFRVDSAPLPPSEPAAAAETTAPAPAAAPAPAPAPAAEPVEVQAKAEGNSDTAAMAVVSDKENQNATTN